MAEDANPLQRWLHKYRITSDELAAASGISTFIIGNVRRSTSRPSDLVKIALAAATLKIEEERGIAAERREGVPVAAWYEPAELERLRKAAES